MITKTIVPMVEPDMVSSLPAVPGRPSNYSRASALNLRVCSVSAISVGSRSMLDAP
jgi:hypothetical protein